MKLRLVESELFYGEKWTDGQIDRQTDSQKNLPVAFHNFADSLRSHWTRRISPNSCLWFHTRARIPKLNPCRTTAEESVSLKDEIWFLCVCHHISNAV